MRNAILARPIASLARSMAFLACSGIAAANTWIVDAAGGPGHHFTAIQPAITAAAPGDLILVRAGTYAGFALDRGLTIMGELPAVPEINTNASISIPAGQRGVVCGLSFPGPSSLHPTLDMTSSGGFILLSGGVHRIIRIQSCADVRIQGISLVGELTAFSSRLEIVRSSLQGRHGAQGFYSPGENGKSGVYASTGARVHLALSSASGGNGGNADFGAGYSVGGDGGHGVHLVSNSHALIFGQGQLIKGGNAGAGNTCFMDGSAGNGLRIAGAAWSSGVTFMGGTTLCFGSAAPVFGGPWSPMQPDQPTLEIVGTPVPGAPVSIRLWAPAGSAARLHLGRNPEVQALPGVLVERLTDSLRTISLGGMPPSGEIAHPLFLPAILPQGMLVIVQGSVTLPGGHTMLTNSVPFVIR